MFPRPSYSQNAVWKGVPAPLSHTHAPTLIPTGLHKKNAHIDTSEHVPTPGNRHTSVNAFIYLKTTRRWGDISEQNKTSCPHERTFWQGQGRDRGNLSV